MRTQWTRLAIVNRGEPAMRLIHAVREYNREHGTDIRTIALFTDPDRHSLYVREADEAVALGPAIVGGQSRYLDLPHLRTVLHACRAEAAWVGWGFVAENPDFVDLCEDLDIAFLGPTADTMRQLGDKIRAKRLADAAHVPTSPWSGGPVDTIEDAIRHAATIGYPLMLKAAAGGGGRGIRRVFAADDLAEAFERARSEALKSFGDASVLMEGLVLEAHHVEVQVIADGQGGAWALGVRDCTLQRRHQKILEETPATCLPPEREAELLAAALRLCKTVNYRGAGTVEFLYRPADGKIAFLEVNTRLQVEHPITEAVFGIDLVKLQIDIGRGGRLPAQAPVARGHAIEVRLCAEDADNHFAPSPGDVVMFRLPTGPGVRVDSGISEGAVIPAEFDSMIAKLIATGADRGEALSRLERALREFTVLVHGGTTNKGFLLQLLTHPLVIAGQYDTGWLDEQMAGTTGPPLRPHADVALIAAALDIHAAALKRQVVAFQESAVRLRPEARREATRSVDLRYGSRAVKLEISQTGPRLYRVTTAGTVLEVERDGLGTHEAWLTYAGRRYRVLSLVHGETHLVEVDGVPHRISSEEGGFVRAPSPAVVVAVMVKIGDTLRIGDRVAVLEAMKLETSLYAPVAGVVREVLVVKNTQVGAGTALVRIEPRSTTVTRAETPIPFTATLSAASPAERLRRLLMGYDGETEARRLLADWRPDHDDARAVVEDAALLELFADIHSLTRSSADARNLDAWLRERDEVESDLPPAFLDRLRAALRHYGVDSTARCEALEESLFWLYRAHGREKVGVAIVLSILERRLALPASLATHGQFRRLLERLMEETRTRHPAVHELAVELRWRAFDKPAYYRTTEQVYEEMEGVMDRLVAARPDEGPNVLMQTLVDCPQPLIAALTRRYFRSKEQYRPIVLEAITRRYYRLRELAPVGFQDGISTWDYPRGDRYIRLLTACTREEDLPAVLATLGRATEAAPSNYDVVVDLYLLRSGPPADPETIEEGISAVLAAHPSPRPWRRLVVVMVAEEASPSMQKVRHFTYRPTDAGGYAEERAYRGFHPMMSNRIRIVELLKNFDIERLPSPSDMYLYRGRARENPRDERLFVFADVREVTLLRTADNPVLRLPELERMLHEALSAIRARQVGRRPDERTHWNRINLYLWPTLILSTDDIISVVRRALPRTGSLGLHKIVVDVSLSPADGGPAVRREIHFGSELAVSVRTASDDPIRPLSEYKKKVLSLRRRDLVYPYEIVRMLTPSAGTRSDIPSGEFIEYDLDAEGRLVPVFRPHGENNANIVVGVVRNFTPRYLMGMTRVILLGDPSRHMGALSEPECQRILLALDLAESERVPVEWFAVSSGARIAMDSGVENMDWIARVLRRIIHFTQRGGEINIVVNGINVGAQPYWNAEATMLMHTRGILIMTPSGAMVLTGKQALDYSGSVSATDNFGIGGYDRIMGPNGQAQYFAATLEDACRLLLRHYEHTWMAPHERSPRPAPTTDPRDRDVCLSPYTMSEFTLVGDIFSEITNPGRKKPFDIRQVMAAVTDQDHPTMDRWSAMASADTAVVWEAHLGGHPVALLGIESRPLPRLGFIPADGPDQWTAGTLFPQSSRKLARALNAASGNRPAVVLANLSGFDGSPESMRRWQLEYGAEIGRAVVNFRGPIVFCVVSRYHGGAYVVFSRTLNDNMHVVAVEGAHASVIGGAPAAAVVFAGEVKARTKSDTRVRALEEQAAQAGGAEKARLRRQADQMFQTVWAEKLGEVATEFDRIHSVQRALDVGAVDIVIPACRLRPYLIEAVERGLEKARASNGSGVVRH